MAIRGEEHGAPGRLPWRPLPESSVPLSGHRFRCGTVSQRRRPGDYLCHKQHIRTCDNAVEAGTTLCWIVLLPERFEDISEAQLPA